MLNKLLKNLLGEYYSESNAKAASTNLLIIVLMFVVSAIMLFFLPEKMPMQWKADGSVNYTLPSVIGVWILPILGLVINLSWFGKGPLKKSHLLGMIVLGLAMIAFYGFVIIRQ